MGNAQFFASLASNRKPVWFAALALFAFQLAVPVASAHDARLGLPPLLIPIDNPQAPEKIALGEKLFFDKRLSADGTISCASCHLPERAFADGKVVAIGLAGAKGTRNTPSLANVAFSTSLFWDGRRTTLEEQAKDPFINPIEHGLDRDAVLAKVRHDPGYIAAFKTVFQLSNADPTLEHVAKAIAAFERTLVFGDSAFDRYQFGGDKSALSDAARRGLEIFRGRGKCDSCHSIEKTAATFTDNNFHSLGIGLKQVEARLGQTAVRVARAPANDFDAIFLDPDISELGRFVVTRKPGDIGRFKTPSLRNVAVTAPYMHDGSVATLEAAVDLEIYYRGAESKRQIFFTAQEKSELVEFLKSLTSAQVLRKH